MTPKEEAEKYFMGVGKYVKCTADVNVYASMGGAKLRTVDATDTIGRVVYVNANGSWGKLEDGGWIQFRADMFTVQLTTPPPGSIADAVFREVPGALAAVGDLIPKELQKILKVLAFCVAVWMLGPVVYQFFGTVKKKRVKYLTK